MRVPLGEAERRVERQDADPALVRHLRGVHVGRLVCDLGEHVARDGSLLADLVEHGVLVVVDLPHLLEEVGNDRTCGLGAGEVDAVAEGEVDQEVAERSDPVEDELRLTDLAAVGPVVPRNHAQLLA
jgi:hypothetical protein